MSLLSRPIEWQQGGCLRTGDRERTIAEACPHPPQTKSGPHKRLELEPRCGETSPSAEITRRYSVKWLRNEYSELVLNVVWKRHSQWRISCSDKHMYEYNTTKLFPEEY